MGTVNGSVEVADYKCKMMQYIQWRDFSPTLVSSLDEGVEKTNGLQICRRIVMEPRWMRREVKTLMRRKKLVWPVS